MKNPEINPEAAPLQGAPLPGPEAGEFAPAQPEERLVHVDFIRGAALFGVLAMNLQYFFRGPYELFVGTGHAQPGFLNDCVDDLLSLLVEGKAMTLFSMLFAVGLAIQLERKLSRGGPFWGFAWRRIGALFAIGAAHIVLIWMGDILTWYALVAIPLFAFLKRKTRTLHIWLGTLLGLAGVAGMVFGFVRLSSPQNDARRAQALADAAAMAQTLLDGYAQTDWWDILVFRLQDYVDHLGMMAGGLVVIFLNFLVGLAVWRSGILQNPAANLPRIRRAALWLTGLGLATGGVHLFIRPLAEFARSHGPWAKVLAVPLSLSQIYHMPLLGLGFGALLLLLWQSGRAPSLLGAVASAGRMALTNYLLQSLVMTAVFCGWGLGLYGKVGSAAGLGISTSFFAIQVAGSAWWLRRYRFGPAEWLWRCAGYARVQPFRRTVPSPVPGLPPVTEPARKV